MKIEGHAVNCGCEECGGFWNQAEEHNDRLIAYFNGDDDW